jgi:uncharacterized protein YutE (UPF0331/DUF86 family)
MVNAHKVEGMLRIVHLYWEVDDALLFNFLQNDLSDFDQFIYFIENYLADEL